jgi:hypothetical protein
MPTVTPVPTISLDTLLQAHRQKSERMPFKVVASFSTFPGRHDCGRAIDGLLSQSYPPDEVIVSIPRHMSRKPDPQSEAKAIKLARNISTRWPQMVRVKLLDTDYGPASKLLGALEDGDLAPDTLVITADDDVEIMGNYVLELVVLSRALERLPHTDGVLGYAVTNAAEGVWRDDIGRYDHAIFESSCPTGGILERSFPMGVAGVAYRAGWFADREIFRVQREAGKGCFFHDDVYFGGHLHRLGVKLYLKCTRPARAVRNHKYSGESPPPII